MHLRKAILLILLLLPWPAFGNSDTVFFNSYRFASAGPDTTPPTLVSVAIGTNGTSWAMTFNESVTESGTGSAWTVAMATAGTITLSAPSPSGNVLTYAGSPTVYLGDTVSSGLNYTQPGNGVEDLAANDLATLTAFSVTNNSTQEVGDGCGTDGLVASWHCENADLTVGTPRGCVDTGEDNTATFTSVSINTSGTPTPVDGSGVLDLSGDGVYDRAAFTAGTASAGLVDEFKITGYAQVKDYANSDIVFSAVNSNSHFVSLRINGSSSDITLQIYRNIGSNITSDMVTTTNCSIGVNEWFLFEAEMKAGVAGTDTRLRISELNQTTFAVEAYDEMTQDKDWVADAGTCSTYTWGYALGANMDGYMDCLKVYNDSQY